MATTNFIFCLYLYPEEMAVLLPDPGFLGGIITKVVKECVQVFFSAD